MSDQRSRIGFTCAYAPLPLFHAAGFVPYRILPQGDAPDRAGSILHENICPHVKKILDRALSHDLPELAGTVVINSCDTMRRLADAWRAARPADRITLVDLPTSNDEPAVAYFARELERLRTELGDWAGRPITDDDLCASEELYNRLATGLADVAGGFRSGAIPGGRGALQELFNRSVTEPPEATVEEIEALGVATGGARDADAPVPLFLFGNVLPDPAAYQLFEECGGQVVGDDLCTGTRQLSTTDLRGDGDPIVRLARGLVGRPMCARTVVSPGALADQIATAARSSGARGAVAYVMKFCDPYLARLPAIRDQLRAAGLPLVILEGDCTMRSLGQHRTRIEAFIEMLAEEEL